MGTESQHRRSAVVALGGAMFLLLLVLAALNAFNPLPPFLRPLGSGPDLSCLPRFRCWRFCFC